MVTAGLRFSGCALARCCSTLLDIFDIGPELADAEVVPDSTGVS